MNFRLRKGIQYTLIVCILLIQILMAVFLYREFSTGKKLAFIEDQLKEVSLLEQFTDKAGAEFRNSQGFFQNYLAGGNRKYLDSLSGSVRRLAGNLDSIDRYKSRNAALQNLISFRKGEEADFGDLKPLLDSVESVSSSVSARSDVANPELKKLNLNFDFAKYDVEKQTYTDTLKKKGLFGRLKDAIAGKENVRKDSTVITLKQGAAPNSLQMRREVDSLMDVARNFYTTQVHNIQYSMKRSQSQDKGVYRAFNNLLVLGNELIGVYNFAIKNAKANLEKERLSETSRQNTTRMNLVFAAIGLMFLASLMVMYFTGLAFAYEKKLKVANQQIRENLKFKNRILGMLSHELRSPLKIMGIFLNRIAKRTDDPTVKDYLKSISFTNNSLLIQANQILDYTKNQHKATALVPVSFNLKNEVESILHSVAPYIETRNNAFVVEENLDPEINVYSDSARLNQLFMNILGNANKFTENGRISVHVATQPVDAEQILLNVSVQDSGVGISEADLVNIFEPYYQGIISEEVENLGAGLGLSLCKEIVELYPGTISVTSELQKGTNVSFSIYLKLDR